MSADERDSWAWRWLVKTRRFEPTRPGPQEAARQRLRKSVLFELADHADADGRCYPGQERICWLVQAHHSTVKRILDEFEGAGLIVRDLARWGNGRHKNYSYELQWDAIAAMPWNGVTRGGEDPATAGLDARRSTAGLDARRSTAGLDARATPVGQDQWANASSSFTGPTPPSAPSAAQVWASKRDAMAESMRADLLQVSAHDAITAVEHALTQRWPRARDATADAWAAVRVAVNAWHREREEALPADLVIRALNAAADAIRDGIGQRPSYVGLRVSDAIARELAPGHDGQETHEYVVDEITAFFAQPRRDTA